MTFDQLKTALEEKERKLSVALRVRYHIHLIDRIIERGMEEDWHDERLMASLENTVAGIKTDLPISGEEMREFEKKKRHMLKALHQVYQIRPIYTYYQKWSIIGTLISVVIVSLFFRTVGSSFIHASWSVFPVSLFLGALTGLIAESIARKRKHTI